MIVGSSLEKYNMANPRVEPCCPSNPEQKALWVKKLQSEKDTLNLEAGGSLAERETLLKTLAHEIRLSILHHLGARPNCVCELVEKLGTSNSAISYHLTFLAKYALIQSENRAGNIYYFLTEYGYDVLHWLDGVPLPKSTTVLNDKAGYPK